MADPRDERRRLAQAEAELREQFPAIPLQRLHDSFEAQVHRYDGAPIRDFVPLLAQRGVRKELQTTETSGPVAVQA